MGRSFVAIDGRKPAGARCASARRTVGTAKLVGTGEVQSLTMDATSSTSDYRVDPKKWESRGSSGPAPRYQSYGINTGSPLRPVTALPVTARISYGRPRTKLG
ncbi:Hypothetical protein NTJ_05745 [Nesidiocoris tenuis]|uniref:Uncharacterized protein n=1 Tax=Nesidiocoris tenuis TaxID=355587 RepID=A0ABN7AL23_9HEMI|nr:Hypothetical protein NTJ_05745 [Nesidiocoris tenuis]